MLMLGAIGLTACSTSAPSSSAPPSTGGSGVTEAVVTTIAAATTAPTTEPSITEVAASEVAPTPEAPLTYPNGIRDVRYCEVLFLSLEAGNYVAEVWNTMGHNECPQAEWDSLDASALAAGKSSFLALLNGPRYWTLDEIDATVQLTAPVETFGTLDMFRAATVDLGPVPPAQSPFTERRVARDTVFRFNAGTEVYELTSPEGIVYVMQSYSQQVDSTLTAERLATLGGVLKLPPGWTYSVRTLDADLEVTDTNGIATVLQDALQNSYQRIDP